MAQQPRQKRRLAAAEETGEDVDRDHGASCPEPMRSRGAGFSSTSAARNVRSNPGTEVQGRSGPSAIVTNQRMRPSLSRLRRTEIRVAAVLTRIQEASTATLPATAQSARLS